jgi:hypothetical protein
LGYPRDSILLCAVACFSPLREKNQREDSPGFFFKKKKVYFLQEENAKNKKALFFSNRLIGHRLKKRLFFR